MSSNFQVESGNWRAEHGRSMSAYAGDPNLQTWERPLFISVAPNPGGRVTCLKNKSQISAKATMMEQLRAYLLHCCVWIILIQYVLPFAVLPARSFLPTERTSKLESLNAAAENNDLDALRRMLEASWNVESMGEVPKDSSTAADAAGRALREAMHEDSQDVYKPGAYFIDLLFPPYDKSAGENMYDEVAAVEFCMELARRIPTQSQDKYILSSLILVRDEKTKQTVDRVLQARERSLEKDNAEAELLDDDEDDDQEEDEDDDDMEDSSAPAIEYYDDFADSGDFSSSTSDEQQPPPPPASSDDDVDSFRQKLMSSWDTTESSLPTELPIPSSPAEKKGVPKRDRSKATSSQKSGAPPPFRLASLFGTSTISQGADMGGDVAKALKENVRPWDEADTIIVLSACEKDELIAIRSILQSAKEASLEDEKQRNVIMVNCKFDLVPRELSGAKTVYGILPLVAKPATSRTNLFQRNDTPEQEKPVKVAVLRQYPRDWEVFVDDGSSGTFERASEGNPMPVNNARGPPMQWVSTCVKNFLQSRMR